MYSAEGSAEVPDDELEGLLGQSVDSVGLVQGGALGQ